VQCNAGGQKPSRCRPHRFPPSENRRGWGSLVQYYVEKNQERGLADRERQEAISQRSEEAIAASRRG